MKKILVLTLLFSLAFLSSASVLIRSNSKNTCPDFSLPYYDDVNNQFTLKDNLNKKNMVFMFFAVWCPSCKKELPQVEAIKKSYPDTDFYAVCYKEKPEKIAKFLSDNKLTFNVLNDISGSVFKLFKIKYIPTVLIVSKSGEIKLLGTKKIEEIKTTLDNLK